MTGVTYFGRYELRGLVGSGGMGEVYEAYDREQNRIVALKLLPAPLASDEGFVERFRRESFAAAQLNDPHVIPIHRYGDIDGRLYIDMRLVKGLDLAGVLERDGPLEAARAVSFTAQAAEALDSAHAANLIHRDVKPSNLLVTPGDFVYLVDFGIAHVFGLGTTGKALTATGATIGTLDYMAPERFIGRTEVDSRTDVYSLTCVLYECLTGERPFPVEGLPALLHAHLNTPAPRPSDQRPELPAALDAVIAKGMAKDPDQRYATTGELAQDATNAIRGTAAGLAATAWVPQPRPNPPTVQDTVGTPPYGGLSPSTPVPTYGPAGGSTPRTPLPPPTYIPYDSAAQSAPATFLPGFTDGGQWPPPGGTGPAGGPEPVRRKHNAGWIIAAAVLVVTAIAAVVVVTRLALTSTGTAAPPIEPVVGSAASVSTSASLSESAPAVPVTASAAPPPATVIITQTATATATVQAPAQTVAPQQPQPQPQQPAPSRGSGDLGLAQPIANLGCSGQYVTFVGSAVDPGLYQSGVQGLLSSFRVART